MADSTINIFGSSGEAMVGADTINTILASMDSKLTSDDINIETLGDGTVDVDVKNDTYSINLNHTHEGMTKLVKCTEATLPQTLADDTIYVQVDNLTTPQEIEALHIFGLEFTGGGGAVPGTPRLISPSPSQISNGIDIGNTTSGTATYSLNIKAKDLTQSLLVEWGSGSTGYSFNTSNLPTGVTYDSGTGKLTITKEAACGINGVDIPVVYTGNDTDENAEGTIGIRSSSVDGINVAVPLVVNKISWEELKAVKLTGTQWLDTGYKPGPYTQFAMKLKFTENANSALANQDNCGVTFLHCAPNTSTDGEKFWFYHNNNAGTDYKSQRTLRFVNKTSIYYSGSDMQELNFSGNDASNLTNFTADEAVLSYERNGDSNGVIKFTVNGSVVKQDNTSIKEYVMQNPLLIGYDARSTKMRIYDICDLTIYDFEITDKVNGERVTTQHWKPYLRNGVPVLRDIAHSSGSTTPGFISSETATELVAIPLTNN